MRGERRAIHSGGVESTSSQGTQELSETRRLLSGFDASDSYCDSDTSDNNERSNNSRKSGWNGQQARRRRKFMIVDGTALLYRAFHAYSKNDITLSVNGASETVSSFKETMKNGENETELSEVDETMNVDSLTSSSMEITSASFGFLKQLLPTLVKPTMNPPLHGAGAPPRTASNAMTGTTSSTPRVLFEKYRSITHLAVCFDSNVRTFRHEMFPDYKRNRADRECPLGVIIGKKRITQLLKAMDIAVLESEEGHEADDIIGSLAKLAARVGIGVDEVEIFSGDKDFLQLLRDSNVDANTEADSNNDTNCQLNHATKKTNEKADDSKGVSFSLSLLRPASKGGGLIHYTYDDFIREHEGLLPSQYIDLLALSGDSSDNIPGLRRVGMKTARKLIAEYGSIDSIFQNVEKVKRKDVRASIMEKGSLEKVRMYRELVTIQTDIDVIGKLFPDHIREDVTSARGVNYEIVQETDYGKITNKIVRDEFDKMFMIVKPEDGGEQAMDMLAELEFFSLIEMIEEWMESMPSKRRSSQ